MQSGVHPGTPDVHLAWLVPSSIDRRGSTAPEPPPPPPSLLADSASPPAAQLRSYPVEYITRHWVVPLRQPSGRKLTVPFAVAASVRFATASVRGRFP
jgi:hypothetical protein